MEPILHKLLGNRGREQLAQGPARGVPAGPGLLLGEGLSAGAALGVYDPVPAVPGVGHVAYLRPAQQP